MTLTLNEYQIEATTTAIFPENIGLMYLTLGLVGEAGEVAEKVKKVLRDKAGELSEVDRYQLAGELGDVLWYLSQLAKELGFDLDTVALANLDKLQDRQKRDKIHGSGDER